MIPEAYLSKVLELFPDTQKPVWCRLVGKSMEPLLCDGDMLQVQPGNRNIRTGDVIIFKSSRNQWAHRVVRIYKSGGGKTYLTKGDNSYFTDGIVRSGQVLAKVLKVQGAHGTLCLDSRAWRIRNFLIAVYSYTEGRRHTADTVFWRLLDRTVAWFRGFPGGKRLYRHNLYKLVISLIPNKTSGKRRGGENNDRQAHEEK